MKPDIIFLTLASFIASQSFSQNRYAAYVNSFPKIETKEVIRFQMDFKKENKMSREEALKFVYNDDTTKMVCIREEYDLMTEKSLGISREESFPYKTMLLDMGDYFLIANTEFDCHDIKKPQTAYVTLSVVDKKYKLADVIHVFRAINETDVLLGAINPKNGLVLLVGDLKNLNSSQLAQSGLTQIDAALLLVDKATLKFKTIKSGSNIKGNYYDLIGVTKKFGWNEFFGGN